MATSMDRPEPPLHFLLPIFPVFQLLDVAGPLDILNLLSLSHPPTRSLTLTFIASTHDPVSTKPISPIDPSTNKPKWTFEGDPIPKGGSVNTKFQQAFNPDVTFESYLAAMEDGTVSVDGKHKPIDVLLIPGGLGTTMQRIDVATGKSASNVADLLDFIPRIAPHVRHSIVTVCTGSDILAQTGLLDGRRATTNMTRFDQVAQRSPAVKWLKGRRWVRSRSSEGSDINTGGDSNAGNGDGPRHHVKRYPREIWTSAGISAGIDIMFAFVEEYYGGLDVAKTAAKRLEYEWRRIGEGEVDPMYELDAGET